MTCLMRGSIGDILSTTDGAVLTHRAIAECSAVAAGSGFEVPAAALRSIEAVLLKAGSPWVASMGRDIAGDVPRIEANAQVGDMVKRAARYGLDVPLTRAAFCNLQVHEAAQRSEARGRQE